ncbi:MAG TPA: hypothetical protein VN300_05420 [Desulfobacterales bacterium]|nr:hypothetical protein [Desulfobacterales bacterium]
MPPLLFKPAGLVHPEEFQDQSDYHDYADDIKDAVHTVSPAIDVLNIYFFNFLHPLVQLLALLSQSLLSEDDQDHANSMCKWPAKIRKKSSV